LFGYPSSLNILQVEMRPFISLYLHPGQYPGYTSDYGWSCEFNHPLWPVQIGTVGAKQWGDGTCNTYAGLGSGLGFIDG